MIPWEVFSHQKLISVTNGWNSKKKIREAYFYKKIFEITIISLTMAEIKQFSIIQAFTALWDIKIKEMAAISKSHQICSKIQINNSSFYPGCSLLFRLLQLSERKITKKFLKKDSFTNLYQNYQIVQGILTLVNHLYEI